MAWYPVDGIDGKDEFFGVSDHAEALPGDTDIIACPGDGRVVEPVLGVFFGAVEVVVEDLDAAAGTVTRRVDARLRAAASAADPQSWACKATDTVPGTAPAAAPVLSPTVRQEGKVQGVRLVCRVSFSVGWEIQIAMLALAARARPEVAMAWPAAGIYSGSCDTNLRRLESYRHSF